MSLPDLAVQNTISALIAATDVPFFLKVPPKTPLPYAVIDRIQCLGDDAAGDFFECQVEVEVYAATATEARTLASIVHGALNLRPEFAGFSCHEHHFENLSVDLDRSGTTQGQVANIEFAYHVQRLP